MANIAAQNQPETIEISPETQAIVEQKMPHASDDVKQKTMELMEAIKQRVQADLKAADDWSNEAYLKAVHSVQQDLVKAKDLSAKYEAELKQSVQLLEDEAQQHWYSLTEQANRCGDRLKQAADSAWAILTQPQSEESSETNPEAQA